MNRDAWLTSFSDYLQYERRYSEHTQLNYLTDIQSFLQFINTQYLSLSEANITHHHIRSWVVNLMKNNVQPRSVRRKLSSLRHYFKWLERKGVIDHQPLQKVPLPKIPERLPKALPQSVIQRILERLTNEVENEVDSRLQLRDRIMLSLLYAGGLRRAELISLKWSDIDIKRMTIRVVGKGSKFRFIPIGIELKALLDNWHKVQKEEWGNDEKSHVITTDSGKPCYPKFIYNHITRLLSEVTTSEAKSPHVLRHSMATHMLDNGADLNAVKELLGHSSLAATQVYTKHSMAKLKAVYKQAHPGAQIRE